MPMRDPAASAFPFASGSSRFSLIAALFFFLALLPVAGNYLLVYPDESHYTDAAVGMIRSGDWLTPTQGDGEPRFNKPILAYWVAAAGNSLSGIGVLGSRIGFLAAGAAILILTARMARQAGMTDRGVIFSVLTLGSHPVLILASTRSIPDVILCLFLLLSAFGFARILCFNDRTPGAYYMAYVGAGLGVGAKGFLPILFVIYVWGFVFRGRTPGNGVKDLVHIPAMLLGGALGGWWFLAMIARHGAPFAAGFWNDQVSVNFEWNLTGAPGKVLGFFAFYGVIFFPWSGMAAWTRIRNTVVSPELERVKSLRGFLLPWCGFLAVLFGAGNNLTTRYLLPASPLLALFLADWLSRIDGERFEKSARNIFVALTILIVLSGVAATYLVFQIVSLNAALCVAAAYFASASGLAFFVGRRLLSASCAIGFSIFLFFPLAAIPWRAVFYPDLATQLGRRLRCMTDTDGVCFVGSRSLAARVRVVSGGGVEIHRFEVIPTDLTEIDRPLIVPGSQRDRVARFANRATLCARGFSTAPTRGFWKAVCQGKVREWFEQGQRDYYWIEPEPVTETFRQLPLTETARLVPP
jgi:4-amino-4-deoxy-L-arabinose transferase-like glycosyltransferase